jgi:oligoribonuclease (3'-5' exoribonuclease)
MPQLHDFLHYRIFDLSSVELVVEGLKTKEVD